jgi:hypothetical protein
LKGCNTATTSYIAYDGCPAYYRWLKKGTLCMVTSRK